MVWRATDPTGRESAKIWPEIVKWTRGKVLDVGCGEQKTFPHFIGVDNGVDEALFGMPVKADIKIEDAGNLSIFGSQSFDAVFSSHLLEHIEPERVSDTLSEWCRIIKPKGYLVMYLPDEDSYPKVGETGANKDHKWNVNYDKVIEYMDKVPRNWDLVDFQKRDQDMEYSLYFVFKVF